MRYLRRVIQYVIILIAVLVARELGGYLLGSRGFWVLLWSLSTGFLVGLVCGFSRSSVEEGFFYGFIFWVLLWGICAGVVVGLVVAFASEFWTGLLWGIIAALDGIIGVHFGNMLGLRLRCRLGDEEAGQEE